MTFALPVIRRTIALATVGFAVAATAAGAAQADDHGSTPPPAALAACASSHEGDTCTITRPGQDAAIFTGVCSAGRQSGPLVCRPAPPKPRS